MRPRAVRIHLLAAVLPAGHPRLPGAAHVAGPRTPPSPRRVARAAALAERGPDLALHPERLARHGEQLAHPAGVRRPARRDRRTADRPVRVWRPAVRLLHSLHRPGPRRRRDRSVDGGKYALAAVAGAWPAGLRPAARLDAAGRTVPPDVPDDRLRRPEGVVQPVPADQRRPT